MDRELKRYRVPVLTNIQLFRHVEVEAADESQATAIVQQMIESETEPGLRQEDVLEAINAYQPPFNRENELRWVPGIVECFEGIEIDRINPIEEVDGNGNRGGSKPPANNTGGIALP